MDLDDESVLSLLLEGKISISRLDVMFSSDPKRAVKIRRNFLNKKIGKSIDGIPYMDYDYLKAKGKCENVIGYIPIPLGIVGPLLVCGSIYWVPIATTEGVLVASIQRGCKAIFESGGSRAFVYADKMTRGPVINFEKTEDAVNFFIWMENPESFKEISGIFDSTSRFVKLKRVLPAISGCDVFLRFEASTGDAMGMNMVSKATQEVLEYLCSKFSEIKRVGLSGNYCIDKKPSFLNWVFGRGKSVVAEVTLRNEVIEKTLYCVPKDLVTMNTLKNFKGSAMAGCIGGGFNAQASNIITAIYLATGQDPAQSIVSSGCMTEMKSIDGGVIVTCTMPCIEVGTVGGGTELLAQSECLRIMGVGGSDPERVGENAKTLSKIICVAVMAGEISLLSSICEGTLSSAHIRLGRNNNS